LGIIALRMGLSPETPLQLAGDLTPLPDTQFVKAVDELLMQALQDHPAVLAAKARLNAAQAAVDERRSARLPSLALTADVSYERNKQPRVFNGNSESN
jgi:outer membrane protein